MDGTYCMLVNAMVEVRGFDGTGGGSFVHKIDRLRDGVSLG